MLELVLDGVDGQAAGLGHLGHGVPAVLLEERQRFLQTDGAQRLSGLICRWPRIRMVHQRTALHGDEEDAVLAARTSWRTMEFSSALRRSRSR